MPSLPFGLLTFAAVIVSLLAGRRTFATSMVIAGGWVFYNAAWWGFSPAALVPLHHTDMWSVSDLLIAAAVLAIGQYRWWSLAIWALITTQVCLHCFNYFNVLDFAPYSKALDTLYVGQLAVLFMAGGRKSADSLLNYANHTWHVLRSAWPTPRKKATQ